MSWLVEIVAGPVPSQIDAAWEFLEELRDECDLHEEPSELSQEMMELYRRLTARYPCIMENSDSPWSDGPLINNFGEKLTAVGIVTSRIAEALPFLIQTATSMGFTVFDGGDEMIHRPKDWKRSELVKLDPPSSPWWRFWQAGS